MVVEAKGGVTMICVKPAYVLVAVWEDPGTKVGVSGPGFCEKLLPDMEGGFSGFVDGGPT